MIAAGPVAVRRMAARPPCRTGKARQLTSDGESPGRDGGDTAAAPLGRPGFDTSVAHQARMYDYWLGGKDNFAADREAAEAALAAYPGMARLARENRAFLRRVVRYLAGEAGMRQFLDIGTGIPTAGNTHEVAQEVAPESRVVYVDYDPVVLTHARALLASSPEGATAYIDADLRDTGTLLERAAQTLDFTRPVAVTMLAVLHAVGDEDDPYAIVARIIKAVPSGSYLAISHLAADLEREKLNESRDRVNRISHQQYTHRSHAEVLRFFDGLELVEPGLVELRHWRPTMESGRVTPGWCGLGRKP
jgi:S-adenosyl methyltransferase